MMNLKSKYFLFVISFIFIQCNNSSQSLPPHEIKRANYCNIDLTQPEDLKSKIIDSFYFFYPENFQVLNVDSQFKVWDSILSEEFQMPYIPTETEPELLLVDNYNNYLWVYYWQEQLDENQQKMLPVLFMERVTETFNFNILESCYVTDNSFKIKYYNDSTYLIETIAWNQKSILNFIYEAKYQHIIDSLEKYLYFLPVKVE